MEKRAPRLQFTDEERTDLVLKKPVRKAQKMAAKADRAQEKIPKKTVKTRERVVDPATGKVTTRLKFEEIVKKKWWRDHQKEDLPALRHGVCPDKQSADILFKGLP